MTKKYKVYSCSVSPSNYELRDYVSSLRGNRDPSVRVIAATSSWKKFAELLEHRSSVSYLRNYGSLTANDKEIEFCTQNPEKIFYSIQFTSCSYDGNYYEYPNLPPLEKRMKPPKETCRKQY